MITRPGPVIGIDPSSRKLAVAIGPADGSGPTDVQIVKLAQGNDETGNLLGCGQAYEFTYGLLADFESLGQTPSLFALERPVQGRAGPHATIVQCFVSGAIQAAVQAWTTAPFALIGNMSWKAGVVGGVHGNSAQQKKMVTDWVLANHPAAMERWGTLPRGGPDQDVADAICIYLFAAKRARLRRKIEATKRRLLKD